MYVRIECYMQVLIHRVLLIKIEHANKSYLSWKVGTIPLMQLFFENIPHFSCRLMIDDNGSKIH